MKASGFQKSQCFKHFSELAKIWKCSLGFSKFQFSTSFMNLEKTWIHSARPTFEDPNFESMDDRENLCPNLSLTVENEMGNSHEKGMITF